MQGIPGFDVLVGLQVEPTLTALFFQARIPHDGKRLQAPGLNLDEILLQRFNAEGVDHRKASALPIGAQRFDRKRISVTNEPRRLLVVLHLRAAEVAKHGLRRRLLHRKVVMRPDPVLVLGLVTRGTTLRPYILSRLQNGGSHRRRLGIDNHLLRRLAASRANNGEHNQPNQSKLESHSRRV